MRKTHTFFLFKISPIHQDGWCMWQEAVKFNLRHSTTTLWKKLKKNHGNPQLEQPVPKSKFGSRFS